MDWVNVSGNFKQLEIKKIALLPVLVFVSLMLLTFGLTFRFYENEREKNQLRLKNRADHFSIAWRDQLRRQIDLLKDIRSHGANGELLSASELGDHLQRLDIAGTFQSIRAIGFVEVENISGNGFFSESETDYKYFKNSGKEQVIYRSTLYLKPEISHLEAAVRSGIADDVFNRQAFERVRSTGQATIGPKTVFGDSGEGFFVYLPVPDKAGSLRSVEAPGMVGILFAAVDYSEFVQSVKKRAGIADLSVRIYDGQIKSEKLLADDTRENNYISGRLFADIRAIRQISFGGRDWLIELYAPPEFLHHSAVRWTPLVFIAGVLISILLASLMFWDALFKSKLQLTRQSLTRLEKQRERLLEKERISRQIAADANLAKGEFISLVSHELRTPLNAIAGWTNIIKSENLSPGVRDMAIEKIEQNIRTQTHLVEELLDYSQIVSGEVPFEKSEFEFAEVFEKVFTDFQDPAEQKGIQLIQKNLLNGETVLGNKKLLATGISNLLDNALKFTPRGGTVRIVLEKDRDKRIVLQISDDGQGIPGEYLPRIFDSFSQEDTSTTRRHGGLGLGLAISRQIVRLHKGTIDAYSEGPGKGATFIVRLPVLRNGSEQSV